MSETDSMIERVARAIEQALRQVESDARVDQMASSEIEMVARAAIKAMREPSSAMIEASNREWDGRMSHRSSGAWQAMIDAALNPPANT